MTFSLNTYTLLISTPRSKTRQHVNDEAASRAVHTQCTTLAVKAKTSAPTRPMHIRLRSLDAGWCVKLGPHRKGERGRGGSRRRLTHLPTSVFNVLTVSAVGELFRLLGPRPLLFQQRTALVVQVAQQCSGFSSAQDMVVGSVGVSTERTPFMPEHGQRTNLESIWHRL